MSRYFLHDTSLAHLEKTMMRPPNFRARGGGVYICRYRHTAADCGRRLTTNELCDPQIISDELFRLIVSAFVIRRYGLPSGVLR